MGIKHNIVGSYELQK